MDALLTAVPDFSSTESDTAINDDISSDTISCLIGAIDATEQRLPPESGSITLAKLVEKVGVIGSSPYLLPMDISSNELETSSTSVHGPAISRVCKW